jgi:hypothetical protein
MRGLRRPLLTVTVVLAALAATHARPGARAATDAAPPLLPTVRCPLRAAFPAQRTPKVADRERAAVPAALAPRLAIYVGGPERVVAPRGWRCTALAAVNGGTIIVVEPREATRGRGVRSWREPACVGCIYDAVCALFPREAAPLSVGLPCGSPVRGRVVTRLSASLARYRDPDGESGLVFLDANAPEAAGVSCRAPFAGVCAAVLADWRS